MYWNGWDGEILMQRAWCNHFSTVPVPSGLCKCFLNAWDTHSEGDTTPFSTLPMPRSTSDREKVLTCKGSCSNALLAVSWKQVTPFLMTGFRKKANTHGCVHLSQVILAVFHRWYYWGYSAYALSPRWPQLGNQMGLRITYSGRCCSRYCASRYCLPG